MEHARFLEDVVQTVSPEVAGKSEVAGWTAVGAGQSGDGVLRKTPLE